MNNKSPNSEKGQAIIFLVLGLVVFLGFVALAIDGGMALADRRHSQNGADASSLAGAAAAALYLENHQVLSCDASWKCNTSDVWDAEALAKTTAINRAAANNFSIDEDPSDHNGVTTKCDSDGIGRDHIDVTVDVSTVTRSNFAHLLFPDELRNEVEAVTTIFPRAPLGFGNAIIALNPQGCIGNVGGVMYGTSDTTITGGGIFSNGCIRGNGNSGSVTVNGGGIVGHDIVPGKLTWSPAPQTTTELIHPSDYNIEAPNCSAVGANHIKAKDLEKLMPTTLTPGLWCITGDLSINENPSDPSTVVLLGEGVTIVMVDGKFTINGGANIQLSAPSIPPNNFALVSPAVRGILLYLPESNSNAVTLNGNEDALFSGLVYAPNSNISMNGTGFNTYENTQLIGWNVEIGGNASTSVTYNGCNSFTRPTYIELSK